MAWTPPERAPWVEHLNAIGENMADGGRAMVPLDAEGLLEAAQRATGLSDFGDPWFRDPLRVFSRALEDEAQLTLLGRLFARSELQRVLESRLRVEDLLKREPGIAGSKIEPPIFVTGLGRSGTTFLHELLAQDPVNRVPMLWEMMYPVPPPERATYATDERIARAHREISLMEDVVPAFRTMQEVGGDLPNECIYIFAHQCATDMWIGEFNVPSYMTWMFSTDQRPAYEYHRRFLQLLQSRHHGERWVLKAPSHLHNLQLLFDVYPDAWVVIAHRDPLRVVGSISNLIASLQWMRSDQVSYDNVVGSMSFGFTYQLEHVMKQRRRGLIPDDRIIDVRYVDLVAKPVETVRDVYRRMGLDLGSEAESRIRARLASRPREQRGLHEYTFADTGLDLATERARCAPYQEHHQVPSEV